MGWQENKLTKDRLKNLKPHERRFRINSGMAWIATSKNTVHIRKPTTVKLFPGDMVLRQARPFRGAPKYWPDLCGWDSIKITPEMVGQNIAVFVGEEVKATGDLSDGQRGFKSIIEKMGGIFIKLTKEKL